MIHHKSGHMGLMNSRRPCPPWGSPGNPGYHLEGKLGVKDRCLTGYLEENAFFTYLKQLPPPRRTSCCPPMPGQEQYAAHGITTIQDGMAVEEMFPMYQMLLDSGILKLDLVVYPSPILTPRQSDSARCPRSAI